MVDFTHDVVECMENSRTALSARVFPSITGTAANANFTAFGILKSSPRLYHLRRERCVMNGATDWKIPRQITVARAAFCCYLNYKQLVRFPWNRTTQMWLSVIPN